MLSDIDIDVNPQYIYLTRPVYYCILTPMSTTNTRPTLRPYQQDLKNDILALWERGCNTVLAVLPTGAGKTVLFSDIIHDHEGTAVAIAHRRELIGQISQSLARDKVRHRIIGPDSMIRDCVAAHTAELGVSYYSPSARCAVASVDSLKSRERRLNEWFPTVTLWVMDEAHHICKGNKWGWAVEKFKNAKGLGVTATPTRADGLGLGRHADGVVDEMVIGPTMRTLINQGHLTPYRIFAPLSDIDLSKVKIGKTGDYSAPTLKTAIQKSHVVGDVVENYLKFAPGKLGVTFASDVETATDIAAKFKGAGISAAMVCAKTSDAERRDTLNRFKNREILMMVNVDLFGEGFDLPAIEVVIMARPTQSYGLYVQQFGRGLRPMEGKTHAIIIDHVGNVVRHGLPDAPRLWTLDRRQKRAKADKDAEILRACPDCAAVYERFYRECPYCGFYIKPIARNAPEFVDGDLAELDEETLAMMRGELADVDQSVAEYRSDLQSRGAPAIGVNAHSKRHRMRQEAQAVLRASMSQWGGYQVARGRKDSESQRRFYHKFGVDVWSAQVLSIEEAGVLTERVNAHIGDGVHD